MSSPRRFASCFVGALVVAGSTSIPAAQKPAPDIPVTTSIADLGDADHAFRVQSDRKGAYVTTTVNKTVQVQSSLLVNRNGTDWSLTTYYSAKRGYVPSERKVFFDLREQIAAGAFATPLIGTDPDGLPAEYGLVTAHLIAKCSVANVDMTRMALGATALCPGSLRFLASDGQWYRFSFAPGNFAGVDPFLVTCTQADGDGCGVWTVTPSGTAITGTDPNPKSRNTLLHIDEGGAILAVGGDYYLSFGFTVAR